MPTLYTTRESRRNVAQVSTFAKSFRSMLEYFIDGDRHTTIHLLNGLRPLDVVEFIMGRELTIEESNEYLESVSNIPMYLQTAFQTAKVWQDMKQGARKVLQGDVTQTRTECVKKFKKFLGALESQRSRLG